MNFVYKTSALTLLIFIGAGDLFIGLIASYATLIFLNICQPMVIEI